MVRLIAVILLFLMTNAVNAQDIVTQLYKNFAWEAFLDNDHLDDYLYNQKPKVLERYFTKELAELIRKDSECASKHGICRLDFNMLFSSQDPSVTDMTIKRVNNVSHVQYKSSGQTISMDFVLANTKQGELISDIIYINMDNLTLKDIFSSKQPLKIK